MNFRNNQIADLKQERPPYPVKMNNLKLSFVPMMTAKVPSSSCAEWRRAAATTALSAFLLTAPVTLPPPANAASYLLPNSIASASVAVPQPGTSLIATPEQKTDYNKVVQEVWRVINYYYIDGSFNGVDWARLGDNFSKANFENEQYAYTTLRRTLDLLKDKYTRVLTPNQMQILNKYDVSGVGLLLTEDSSGNLVVATEPDKSSSAGQAAIRQGDIVLAVDGKPVDKLSAFIVAQLMQGDDGSIMTITFQNRGRVELVRRFTKDGGDRAVSRAVIVDRKDGRMAYIRLSDFIASSRLEVTRALRDLRNQHADWVVLDLRGNTGGVFEDALEIAGLFEGDGAPMVDVRGRGISAKADPNAIPTGNNGEFREEYGSRFVKDTGSNGSMQTPWTDVDLAIVMDERSASSSEVLAGGLRENCKAALVGEHSFGKGLIQGVFGLPDGGGVIVTVAEYRTPSGMKIHGTGLDPDIKLKPNLVDSVLRTLGIKRISEDSVDITHDEVRQVLRMCREQRGQNVVENTSKRT